MASRMDWGRRRGSVQPYQRKRTSGIRRASSKNSGRPFRAMVCPTEMTARSPSRSPQRRRKASRLSGLGAKKEVSTPLEMLYTGFFSP